MKLISVCIALVLFTIGVSGHGYLMDPPGRASAWRFGFDTPQDYNDNECFCGGFDYQYQVNGGKCGICGDPYDEGPPREHEVGSIYATGTLVRNYTDGDVITVVANVTANHLGHFEYKICANNDVTVEATQECLDLTPLYPVGGDDYFLWIGSATGAISHDLQLPTGLTCTQCVFQWRYIAANTWGTCANGTEAVGCGPQEEFRGCADVSIRPSALEEVKQLQEQQQNEQKEAEEQKLTKEEEIKEEESKDEEESKEEESKEEESKEKESKDEEESKEEESKEEESKEEESKEEESKEEESKEEEDSSEEEVEDNKVELVHRVGEKRILKNSN